MTYFEEMPRGMEDVQRDMFYILDDHDNAVSTNGDHMAYARWIEANRDRKHIAKTTLSDGTWISTVFLGMNHAFRPGPPLIFETMVFPSENNMDERECHRYSTMGEARSGHYEVVTRLQEELNGDGGSTLGCPGDRGSDHQHAGGGGKPENDPGNSG